jgi:hypothetical protein
MRAGKSLLWWSLLQSVGVLWFNRSLLRDLLSIELLGAYTYTTNQSSSNHHDNFYNSSWQSSYQ